MQLRLVVLFLAGGLVALATAACSKVESSATSSPDLVQAEIAAADEVWFPDLDEDGDADVMMLTGQEIRFALARDDVHLEFVYEDGEYLAVPLDEGVTVTCQAEGAFVQTFDRPTNDADVGPLRLYSVDINGSQGILTPGASFFFGSDFDLPDLGAGCPTDR